MRKRTGLRNKFRTGRSSYSISGKAKTADRYGSYNGGQAIRSESIAGKVFESMTWLTGGSAAKKGKRK
jgi:hypothetical protein